MTLIVQLAVVVAGIAWLTAGATAVRYVSRIWLRHWVEQRLTGGLAPDVILDRPQRLILSAGAGISALALLGGALVAVSRPAGQDAVAVLGMFALAAVVLGQIVPRAIARRWPAPLIPVLLPVVRGIDLLVTPVRMIARPLVARVRARPAAEEPAEVIEDVLREGELEGIGEHGEIAIITGVVQFSDKVASQVMTPRRDVFAVRLTMPALEMARAIAASGFSRIPVYRDSIDDAAGMVHAFDVMKLRGERAPPVRPVEVASPRTPCNDLLFRMLRSGHHLALIREGATVLGIVTLEDLLEELVGDIRDEHDEPALPGPPAAA